jgi:hypothetical protein
MDNVERCPWCGGEISRSKFEEITTRIRAEEQRKSRAQEVQIKQTLEQRYKAQLEKEKKTWLETAKVESEKVANKRLIELRQVMTTDHGKALAKKDGDHKRAVEKLQADLKDLTRRLEKKTANELGDGAEVDLFEALKAEFPDDYIARVKRGEAGADIHHTIRFRGEKCGLIVYDSKNRMQWKYEFAKKLRQDQVSVEADYAVLSTTVFPTGKRELCNEENVIVVNPLRATYVARILRDALVKLHKQAVSVAQRQTKVQQIYELVTSDEYSQKLSESIRLTDSILNIDVKEEKEHARTWKERGMLLTTLKKVLRDIDEDVYAVLGGKETKTEEHSTVGSSEEIPF